MCCMGFRHIGAKESYSMMHPVKRVNQGIILSGTSLHVKPELKGQKSRLSPPLPLKKKKITIAIFL